MTGTNRQMVLKVRKGEPFRPGDEIPLDQSRIRLGRIEEGLNPDVGFSSPNISRFHAAIYYENQRYYLYHPNACTNGILLNRKSLDKETHTELFHGDRIEFAGDQVQLIFWDKYDLGTPSWDDLTDPPRQSAFTFDPRTHMLTYQGESIEFPGNEYRLLCVLYKYLGEVVEHESIRRYVWDDRQPDINGKWMVGENEETQLVNRANKRIREKGWGAYCQITSSRGSGYRLEIKQP